MNNNGNGLQTSCIAPTYSASTHSHVCRTSPMFFTTQSLGEAVRCHILGRDVLYPNDIVLNCITAFFEVTFTTVGGEPQNHKILALRRCLRWISTKSRPRAEI